MRPGEAFLFWLMMVAATIAVPWLAFALASLFAGFPRLRLSQLLGVVGVVAWAFGLIVAADGPGGPMVLLITISAAIMLMAFTGMWAREFRLLMLRRSDEFPDRLDKASWALVLTAMAPAGVWLFRSYRQARWPEPAKEAPPHPLDEGDLAVDAPEMQRIGA